MPDAADLVAHARETRVVVIGADGAVAALECAKVGMSVTWLVADVVAADVDADGFRADVPEMRELLADLGLADEMMSVPVAAPWIAAATQTVPLPQEALLGIPANPWDPAARRLIGWRGTWRAYLDSLRPPLTIGRERNLAALVGSRMGDRVRDRLVAPVTRARFGLEPADVDVEAVLPGLNSALTRTGSLGGAVTALLGEPVPTRVAFTEGPAVWDAALRERLTALEVDIRDGAEAISVGRLDDGWEVEVSSADDAATDAVSSTLTADIVIVATGADHARELLGGVIDLPVAEAMLASAADVVTMRVSMNAPERLEVLPLSDELGAGVRRVLDATAVAPASVRTGGDRWLQVVIDATDATDDDVVVRARAAASVALGVPLGATDVRAASRTRVGARLPSVRAGAEADRDEIRRAVAAVPGLAVTGRWLAGGDLSADVVDAVAEARRVRRHALWDDVAVSAEPRD